MNKIRTLILSTNKVYHLLFILSLTLVLPFFVHKIPSVNGIPIGAILLPMFYIPIPSLYLFKDFKLVALSVGLAPVINHLVTGRPAMELMVILIVELMVYTLIVGWLLEKANKLVKMNAGGIGYLLTKVISSASLILPFKLLNSDPTTFFISSVKNAVPGIIILCIISQICYFKLQERG